MSLSHYRRRFRNCISVLEKQCSRNSTFDDDYGGNVSSSRERTLGCRGPNVNHTLLPAWHTTLQGDFTHSVNLKLPLNYETKSPFSECLDKVLLARASCLARDRD